MIIQGFIVPSVTAQQILNQIAAVTTWTPATRPLPNGQIFLAASPSLFDVQVTALAKFGDHPLASTLLLSLGGWPASVELDFVPDPDPTPPPQ